MSNTKPSLWKPGQSGNPSGRPKAAFNLREQCQQKGPEIIDFLMSVVRGEVENAKTSDRGKAAELLLAYGFGRPIQSVEVKEKRPILLPQGIDDLEAEIVPE